MTHCATYRLSCLLCPCRISVCLYNLLPLSVQVGALGILRSRCQVKSQETPQFARTASTTTNLVTPKLLMTRPTTSNMGTATHAMATARVIVTARAIVAAPYVVMHRCLSQRKGCGSVAGRDSELNWTSLLAADTSTEGS